MPLPTPTGDTTADSYGTLRDSNGFVVPVAGQTSTPVDAPTPSPYYSRYDSAGGASTPAPAQSLQQAQNEAIQGASGEINALNQYYASKSAEQKTANEKNDRSTSAISTLTGLAGSTEADVRQKATSKEGQKANDAIMAEQASKIAQTLRDIKTSATNDYNTERSNARLDATAQADAVTKQKANAVEHIKNLTAGAVR